MVILRNGHWKILFGNLKWFFNGITAFLEPLFLGEQSKGMCDYEMFTKAVNWKKKKSEESKWDGRLEGF